MAEWFKAAVLKTAVAQVTGGSNPSLSATFPYCEVTKVEDTISAKLQKTAGEVAQRIGEAAKTAGDRISEMRERDRLSADIARLQRDRDQVRQSMLDLLMRMFDQNVLVEQLLKPDYLRIKELDAEIAHMDKERAAIGKLIEKDGESA